MLWFTVGFSSVFVFYNLLSLALQQYFYVRNADSVLRWRIQKGANGRAITIPPAAKLLYSFCGGCWPEERERAVDHDLISSINLLTASAAAGIVFQATAYGFSGLQFDIKDAGGLGRAVLSTALAMFWQSLVEYYWHRLMHLPWFYKRFHKMHHYYKSPQPFDDMYIHPLEAAGYYCILYSPAFIFRMHWIGFAVYMAIMGTCGVLDHCGIQIRFEGLYTTADHDRHHQLFDCNYAFPFIYMDILHGTFVGSFGGRQFSLQRGQGTRNTRIRGDGEGSPWLWSAHNADSGQEECMLRRGVAGQ